MNPASKTACSICERANPEFESLNRQINQARTPKEKAPFAKQLIAKADEVLKAHSQAGDSLIAQGCQTVLNLRKQTAQIILKAQKLQ